MSEFFYGYSSEKELTLIFFYQTYLSGVYLKQPKVFKWEMTAFELKNVINTKHWWLLV